MMRILIDTDAFCKLAACELLCESVDAFGFGLMECGRLPALPYMLAKGSLPTTYGPEMCNKLIQIAKDMPEVHLQSDQWMERLVSNTDIDPGEAVLLSKAAEARIPLMTGDKRALRALKHVQYFPEALTGQIVALEAVFLVLCDAIGLPLVRERIQKLVKLDAVAQVCFSQHTDNPEKCINSYLDQLMHEVSPLTLWSPQGRDPK